MSLLFRKSLKLPACLLSRSGSSSRRGVSSVFSKSSLNNISYKSGSELLQNALSSSASSSSSYKVPNNFFLSSKQQRRSLSSSTDSSAGGVDSVETREFQAETRKLLDIVTHSIYTDKEVFLRELVSNASDSLEKFRYKQVLGEIKGTSDLPLEIKIDVDEAKKTITITDSGIGMSRDELISNLGTIARSGSKQFVEKLKESSSTSRDGDSIIGQFGVGFYSSFMVADKVDVDSASAMKSSTSEECTRWSSDGTGKFQVSRVNEDGVTRGTRITMHLKESCLKFLNLDEIKTIIKKYSSFVSFPIRLNGETVNTVSALWLQDKKSVTPTQYSEFYKFISNAYDEPRFTLHFRVDAPLDLKCLFFVPTFHHEKFGMGRMEMGVNLYSRKVLIENKPKDLLPDWLRFVKGVVDSEDLPLSLSREKPQDTHLIKRIREVLTRKLIKFLDDKSKDEPEAFKEFYLEYNMFLKEGICHDHKYTDQIAKLLRFESSSGSEGEQITFDDYIARCDPTQKQIYYLVAPSRDAAMKSPYYETFRKHKKEVLFLYNTIDDFVMSNVKKYSDRELISAETSSINFADEEEKKDEEEDKKEGGEKDGSDESSDTKKKLTEPESADLCAWLKLSLGAKVKEVKVTNRLSDSPAIVTDHQNGALRKMMRLVDQANNGKLSEVPPQTLEINPKHPIIVLLYGAKAKSESAALMISEQLLDNAMIQAGLVDDPRQMIPRMNQIIEDSLRLRK